MADPNNRSNSYDYYYYTTHGRSYSPSNNTLPDDASRARIPSGNAEWGSSPESTRDPHPEPSNPPTTDSYSPAPDSTQSGLHPTRSGTQPQDEQDETTIAENEANRWSAGSDDTLVDQYYSVPEQTTRGAEGLVPYRRFPSRRPSPANDEDASSFGTGGGIEDGSERRQEAVGVSLGAGAGCSLIQRTRSGRYGRSGWNQVSVYLTGAEGEGDREEAIAAFMERRSG